MKKGGGVNKKHEEEGRGGVVRNIQGTGANNNKASQWTELKTLELRISISMLDLKTKELSFCHKF